MTAIKNYWRNTKQVMGAPVSAAPLAVFRVAFGVMMLLGVLRFIANGWVQQLYVQPTFYFTYYGFEWVKPLGATGMYIVFALLLLTALFIALGLFYRLSALLFFLLFTYVELIDKTNYLNHYYFISVVSFLLVWLPANQMFSLDKRWGVVKGGTTVPRWALLTVQLQMALVYFFAGIAKINTDWLINAMPLKLWLPVRYDAPLLGPLMRIDWIPYLFSWCGMLFDVLIPFFLFNRRTVWYAYGMVVVFHVLTAILFPVIGLFPFIMVVCATVFLPSHFHQRLLSVFVTSPNRTLLNLPRLALGKVVPYLLVVHFAVQVLLPFRYLLYPGKLFYAEEGYRFSWRVMLMEKAGHVFYSVKDATTGRVEEVNVAHYLTMQQQKQMSTQPDMILQFAHYLKQQYGHTMQQPEVYAEAYVTVNGRASRLLIDPTVNLANQSDGFFHKKWILANK